jgi:putative hemolysin
MAEMAVVSARQARLRQRAEEGSRGASVAIELAQQPDDFLSTVQVGITLIGTLAGAFGGATIAEKLGAYLKQFPMIAAQSESIAISLVVVIISYLSLILGELVPKGLALRHAETIASAVAPFMRRLARIGTPVVRLLTFSTRIVLMMLPDRKTNEAPVTEDEIKVLIAQGTAHGTFEEQEKQMVAGVFRLGDRSVADLLKPRQRVVWLDVNDDWSVNERKITSHVYSRFPVADGDLDRPLGIIHVKDLFAACRKSAAVSLTQTARKPMFVLESNEALDVLEMFQKSGQRMALVIDEHGGVQGIVTLADLIQAVVGDLRAPGEDTGPRAIRRDDGSWLVDGTMAISDLLDTLGVRELPGEDEGFTTVGGLVMANLNRIPSPGDHFMAAGWRFEVLDMDGNRVDKVLVARETDPTELKQAVD